MAELDEASAGIQGIETDDRTDRECEQDRMFEAFKRLVPYLRGALWWAKNDLLKQRQNQFNQSDQHIGHPLLSVRKSELQNRFDTIPMLVGTTGAKMDDSQKEDCVIVTGLTRNEPEHRTYFGSIIMPGRYHFSELMDGVQQKREAHAHRYEQKGSVLQLSRRPWHEYRMMYPNPDKGMVSESEMRDLTSWCERHGL